MPNVTITPPSVIKVQVGNATNPQVSAINYGTNGATKLRDLTDVNATDLQDGYGVVYVSSTDKFTIAAISGVSKNIDNGFF